jgi:F-type H+-transporting ATPase subunit delta
MSLAAANRYARALSDIVMAPSSGIQPEAVLEQLRAFHQALESSPEMSLALMSPAVSASNKRAAITRLSGRFSLPPVLRNFLLVIVDRRRLPLLGEIVEAFEKAVDDRLGRVRATITSASPLTPQQQRLIETGLQQRTGRQVRSDYRTDPALIGGVSAQIGSTIYDGSVRGRLRAMRARMASE